MATPEHIQPWPKRPSHLPQIHQHANLATAPTSSRRQRLHPNLTFSEAFALWIERRLMKHATLTTSARYISERTEWDYRQYARALEKFFSGLQLCEIRPAQVETYQRDRAFNNGERWVRQTGPNRIRKETGMLIRMLREAGCWREEEEESFEAVQPVENDVPRAMSPEEQDCFLRTAASSERWTLIYAYSILALQTTASTNELRGLRIGDVMLSQGVLQIRRSSAKNRFRVRTIPIETTEAKWACEMLLWRAGKIAGNDPQHYLLPFGAHGGHSYNPDKPMSDSGLKKLWDEVRKAAELPWLRPYDLRHTAITRLAENGVAVSVILDLAGHISRRMQQHYTTISMVAKRKSVASTWSVSTVHSNMRPPAPPPPPQIYATSAIQ